MPKRNNKNSHFMFVDDSDADRFLFDYLVRSVSDDVTLTPAGDGEEALILIRDLISRGEAPHVVFLDINMPRMNGYEFLGEYHKMLAAENMEHFEPKDLPAFIILTTSYREQDYKQTMAYDFVVDYIEKPLKKERISEILDALL